MSFSRELVAVITETTFKQAQLLATDLELFAKYVHDLLRISNHVLSLYRHAKRSTVSVEDVRLCSRRSPSLSEFITKQGEKLRAEREGGGGASADKPKKTSLKGKGKKSS